MALSWPVRPNHFRHQKEVWKWKIELVFSSSSGIRTERVEWRVRIGAYSKDFIILIREKFSTCRMKNHIRDTFSPLLKFSMIDLSYCNYIVPFCCLYTSPSKILNAGLIIENPFYKVRNDLSVKLGNWKGIFVAKEKDEFECGYYDPCDFYLWKFVKKICSSFLCDKKFDLW